MSHGIARFIRSNHPNAASHDVLVFSATIILNTLVVTLAVLLAGLLFGRFWEAALLLFSYVLLRFFSGGMHLHTSKHCNIVSIAMFLILLFLPVTYWNIGFILNIAALLLVIVFAPTKDIMHLNLLGPKYTPHFKLASIAIVSLNFWLQLPILSLAFIAQGLSLTPPAYKAAELLKGGEKS